MPKLKQTFIRGRMNKDLDERLVPKGEYRDGQNIQVSTSEGSDVGAIENVLGNTKKNNKPGGGAWDPAFGLTNSNCIGVARDSSNEKIYWFVTSTSVDAILEYDQTADIVAPVLVDTSGVLNFNVSNLITAVNILENQLFWTDDLNEPRVINIDTFKAGSAQTGSTLNSTTHVYGATRDFTAEDITVIRKAPQNTLTVVTSPSIYSGIGTGITPITDASFGVLPSTLNVGDTSGLSWTGAISWTGLTTPKVVITAEIDEVNGVVNKYEVTGTLSSIGTISATITIDSITPNIPASVADFEMLLVEDEPIFKNDFPRFSYRYKYVDGQYSPYGPFTNAGFVPGKFEYSGRDGFNIGMEDVIRKIELSGFSTTPVDVDEVEVLYKNASSNNIYLIESFNYDFTGITPALSVSITSDALGRVIESSQLLRLYDNVPQKAKAQEVVANRIIYGNYVQNYDVINGNIIMEVGQNNTAHSNVTYGKASVKTDRKYQIGISFLDDYGRESPVFTSTHGSISLQKQNSDKENKIKARLKSTSATPAWANSFKLYIKNNTPEYYNLGLDRYYDAIDGNVWLSFPSSERNKVQEGGFIVLKKGHESNVAVKENNRYKINNISNEAPEHIANVKTAVGRAAVFGYVTGAFPGGFVVGSNKIYFYGPNAVPIENDKLGHDPLGANENFINNIVQGGYIQFSNQFGGGSSFMYQVVSGGPTGALIGDTSNAYHSIYEIILLQNIKPEDAWLTGITSNITNGEITITSSSFRATVFNNKRRALPEFEGRFFVKINPNGTFLNNVSGALSDLSLPLVEDAQLEVDASIDNSLGPNDVKVTWEDTLDPNNNTPDLPAANSDIFALALARTDNIGTNRAEIAAKFYFKLVPGVKIKFLYDNGTLSNDFYTIINRSILEPNYSRTGANGTGDAYQWQLDRDFNDTQFNGTPSASQLDKIIIYREQSNTIETVSSSKNPAIFETEPEEFSDLDIYYEASAAVNIDYVNDYQVLSWHNCYSFGNGVESDRIRDDFNAPILGKGVRVNSTLEEPYRQERRSTGLIFSGIFNSISGINNTNQFLIAETITKDIDPVYGSIQKLHTRDTNLVTLCEDKSLRILADKDALYNADGNTNITSSRNVLGQTVPFAGEFGISKNPESFVSFGFRAYYTDKARGAVIRLSNDGITVISDKSMSYYFNQQLKAVTQPLIGSYDEDTGAYNVRLNNKQLSFLETVGGWTTRLTYAPEGAISLNTEYYTFKDGELWEHSNTVTRANFYGTQENTTVTTIINDGPSSIKNFKALSYEGDEGWTAAISTKDQNGVVNYWKDKEGIYFNFIEGNNTALSTKNFSTQGISSISSTIAASDPIVINFAKDINVSAQVDDTLYYHRGNVSTTIGLIQSLTSSSITAENAGNVTLQSNDFLFVTKPTSISTSGITGYYSTIVMTNTSAEKRELFAVNTEAFISSE
tara:strand:- start:1101 stop:5441 length:4341 start_codon:yes stop_codon:yes gene_type:complete